MPSVITTASPIWASTASSTAPFAPAGGTKMTLTSAPVSFIASATLPNTGTLAPSNSTDSPAFFGFTPPTIAVPEASMRWVCLRPSEPVMPWTMTLLFSLRKIDISLGSCLRSEGAARSRGPPRACEGAPALLHVVAVQADDQRLGGLLAQQLQGVHDPVRHGVAGGDAPEDVDE